MKRKKAAQGAIKKKKKPYGGSVPAVLLPHGQVNKSAGTEIKSVDFQVGPQNLATTAVISAINIVVEGASYYQRIGRRIRMKSLQTRMFVVPSNGNAAATQVNRGRIMIVYDRQSNGALPAYADIVLSQTQAGATTSDADDMLNMNNRDRFWVLMDEYVMLPPVGISGASPASTVLGSVDINNNVEHSQGRFNISRFIKLKGLETQFKASAGAIADIATGSLILVSTSYNDANAQSAFVLDGTIRLKFYD